LSIPPKDSLLHKSSFPLTTWTAKSRRSEFPLRSGCWVAAQEPFPLLSCRLLTRKVAHSFRYALNVGFTPRIIDN
jgi:hypothetical protein